jgi:pyridoxal phosphate enzyme (YggS family)
LSSTTPSFSQEQVIHNVGVVRSHIADICGEAAQGVQLVAVTKNFGPEAWEWARDAGCYAVGENYAQEALAKALAADIDKRLPLHFIGHLQSNKLAQLYGKVHTWQTIDRESVILGLAKLYATHGGVAPFVLLQVNIADETQKSGCHPRDVAKLVELARSSQLHVGGLMAMGPTNGDPLETRQTFRETRKMCNELGLLECSAGMSHDYRIALEEGATIIRVGSAIFGERPQ